MPGIEPSGDADSLAYLQTLNRRHLQEHAGESELEARIAAYELSARLQLSAPEATDLSAESPQTQQMYEIDDEDVGPFGRQCLMARRLVERGVRFVQIYCGAENTTAKAIRPNWDSHEDLKRDHGYWGRVLDTGASALLQDLQSRGLLDETLVICTTEFGRQPAGQKEGRGPRSQRRCVHGLAGWRRHSRRHCIRRHRRTRFSGDRAADLFVMTCTRRRSSCLGLITRD